MKGFACRLLSLDAALQELRFKLGIPNVKQMNFRWTLAIGDANSDVE